MYSLPPCMTAITKSASSRALAISPHSRRRFSPFAPGDSSPAIPNSFSVVASTASVRPLCRVIQGLRASARSLPAPVRPMPPASSIRRVLSTPSPPKSPMWLLARMAASKPAAFSSFMPASGLLRLGPDLWMGIPPSIRGFSRLTIRTSASMSTGLICVKGASSFPESSSTSIGDRMHRSPAAIKDIDGCIDSFTSLI